MPCICLRPCMCIAATVLDETNWRNKNAITAEIPRSNSFVIFVCYFISFRFVVLFVDHRIQWNRTVPRELSLSHSAERTVTVTQCRENCHCHTVPRELSLSHSAERTVTVIPSAQCDDTSILFITTGIYMQSYTAHCQWNIEILIQLFPWVVSIYMWSTRNA